MTYSIFAAVLLGAAWALAKVEAHVDIALTACHTNGTDPEDEKQLDGDEMFYVDFKNKEIIFTLPEFADKSTATTWLAQAQATYQLCINDVKVAAQSGKYPPEEIDPPQSTIYSMEDIELGKSNTLICFVNNFYPPPVKVKWTKNDVEVKDGVTRSRYYPNTDFTFQHFSTLSIIPEEGDVYSCSVEHKGLQGPLTRIWGRPSDDPLHPDYAPSRLPHRPVKAKGMERYNRSKGRRSVDDRGDPF
ncbi:hypothetical protein SKAU_G00221270 [Synaphobranchus kaupii]|uniref:Ig-like domain-containing protein n=1 Tax=Synaphobranchus kaupii TaxID=118154 RepID=A0A9Q1FAY9_SYNKA|nr:hypothetical protein SKAU_G00221270 [Synaphobranchus kaupii]